MAALRLDTAQGQHRLPTDIDQITAHGHGQQRGFGEAEFGRADEDDLLVEPGVGEDSVDPAEAEFERERDMVAEGERCRAGAALAPVDGDEVDPTAGDHHLVGQFLPEAQLAHGRFDPDR